MTYYYNPEAMFLLVNQTEEKDKMIYADSLFLQAPKIGPRPPYYIHPRYEAYYPII